MKRVGYLLVLQVGDARRYILYEQLRPTPYLIRCARVTGRWVLLSSAQNVVRWLTFNLKPRLSIMDFVLQLDKSRKESLSLRLPALIQKVSMESLRGVLVFLHSYILCTGNGMRMHITLYSGSPQTLNLQYETGFVCT